MGHGLKDKKKFDAFSHVKKKKGILIHSVWVPTGGENPNCLEDGQRSQEQKLGKHCGMTTEAVCYSTVWNMFERSFGNALNKMLHSCFHRLVQWRIFREKSSM